MPHPFQLTGTTLELPLQGIGVFFSDKGTGPPQPSLEQLMVDGSVDGSWEPFQILEDDYVFSPNSPESWSTNPPGHPWRDKWTALRGPLSSPVIELLV